MRSKSLLIRELTSNAEWLSMYRLVKQANPKMTRKEFTETLAAMREKGYRCAAAYADDAMVGLVGFWIGWRFWCGKYIDIDNLVVDKNVRSKGVGKQLVAWVEKEGKRQKCAIAVLDSYTYNYPSHRFYFREGYVIYGYHFTKDLA